jgi:aminotransferase
VARPVNEMVSAMPPSGIREFFDLVQGMDDVISLGVGEPDFATPWRICDAAVQGLRQGVTSYTSNSGLLELREAIAEDVCRRYGVAYDPATEIIVTAGVSEGLDVAMRVLLEPGDAVIVPEPCYVSYGATVELAGGRVLPLVTREEDDFRLLPEALEESAGSGAKALLMGYPNNPTGAAMTREDLLRVAEVAERHSLFVLSDEIYAHLTYDGEHTCFASLPGMRERTLLLNGFSKAYAMTGWRLGYACGPAELIEGMVKVHGYTALCSSVVAQLGAIVALRECEREMREMVRAYDERRRVFVKGLNDIGLRCFQPRGAFYAFPSIHSTGLSSREFSRRLLFEKRVAAVPGGAFGACGEGYLRCTYATGMDQLKEALARMAELLEELGRD